jgi:hypothetical protein
VAPDESVEAKSVTKANPANRPCTRRNMDETLISAELDVEDD